MENEKGSVNDQGNRLSINAKQQPKNQSVGPIGRGHHMLTEQTQSTSNKMHAANQNSNPYNNGTGSMQQIQIKNAQNQNNTQFQQYVLNQNQQQVQNSRNTVQKSGIGGRLNTKNNNMSNVGGRQNTQSSFSNMNNNRSPQKTQINQPNTIFINNMQGAQKSNGFQQQQSSAGTSAKLNKKKVMSTSSQAMVVKNNKSFDKSPMMNNQNQSKLSNGSNIQMTANQANMNLGTGSQHNTFYGNINSMKSANHP